MVEITPNNENGSVIVSRDVIATIAAKATLEVEGVLPPQEMQLGDFVLSRKQKNKPHRWVKVEYTNEVLELTVHLDIKHGMKIVKVSKEVQEKVKQEIETMTGTTVSTVNVTLLGVTV